MGLDQYLYTNSKKACKAANKATGAEPWRYQYGTAIYWRKANAIHQWFVENVQYGEDDCHIYEVDVDQLKELLAVCEEVLADRSKAEELLPTQAGFFFGSLEYDEWYWDDVKQTAAGIRAILENIEPLVVKEFPVPAWREKGDPDEWEVRFYYSSSW